MKTKTYKQIFIILAVSVFVIPQIVLAAWWNPLSWSVWNIFRSTPQVQQVQIATTTTPTVIATTTEKADTKVVSTKKPVINSTQKVSQPNIKQPSITVPSQPIPTPVPSCQTDIWSCDNWSSCSASGNQTRSCTKTFDCPSINTPTPIISQSCVPITAPVITPTPTPAPQTYNQNTSPVSNETISQQNAVKKAKSYLDYSAFSHDGLVAQLEYGQFSHADAVYGADNSGANWNEQALKKAKSYLDYSAFSRDGLVDQLEYSKFSSTEAVYGADNVGANWNEQAAKKAKSYMEYSAFSRGGLIDQLKYSKFTQTQAEYGANAVGL